MKREIKIYTPIQKLALDFSERAMSPTDQAKVDITDLWQQEKITLLKHENKINVNITGDTTKGKSTFAIIEAIDITNMMIRLGQTKKPFTTKNIARSQYEYSKYYRDPENDRSVLVTDEYDALDDTGENATTEIRAREHLSDMNAQKYIHSIACSPRHLIDKNAAYHIDIINRDDTTCKTYALLSYSMHLFTYMKIPIGYIEVSAKDLIRKWLKIRPIFLNYETRLKNKELIDKLRSEDFYTNYQCRKHEQMELLTRHNIQKKRDLEYAQCVKELGELYKPYAELNMKYKGRIPQAVETWYNKNGMMMSLIGKDQAIRRVESHLELYKNKAELISDLRKFRHQAKESPSKESEDKLVLTQKAISLINQEIEDKEAWLNKMIEIKKEWDKI